ncbi:MAG: type II toxin-antitoxin system Phd/YefM family antitoxin [Acidobacteriia bacterium]|nr:type II toxin-antitoxin system Phd/YefM family antitoxin [Terriglobia bacterium]
MADSVNIHDAKTHLSKLLSRVMEGEEIIIAKAGKPVARLVPERPARAAQRTPGIDKGKLWIADDFDTMSEAELAEWYGSVPPK